MTAPELKTAREWLEPFGVERLDTSEVGLNVMTSAPVFPTEKHTGEIFFQAGCSEVILMMAIYHIPEDGSTPWPIRNKLAVVRDDTPGMIWDAAKNQGDKPATPRPRPRLKVALIG